MVLQKTLQSHLFIILLALMLPYSIWAKDANTTEGSDNKVFANQELMSAIFKKLYNLEKTKQGKINIVHIGDSHIQADFFTNTIREALQSVFGNGGYGFTFPYSLLRSNGTRSIHYTSNVSWQSLLNVYPVADVGMGLSGIALYTSASKFMLQLAADDRCSFNTIKVIYPSIDAPFKMSVSEEPLSITATPATHKSANSSITMKHHTVRKGETLSTISKKYGISVSQIKSMNALRKNSIKPGQKLKVSVKVKTNPKTETKYVEIDDSNVEYINLTSKPYYSSYTSQSPIDRVTILPNGRNGMYNLNGFVIENNQPGVIYHTIGVNGAKMSDYNKYPLFFKQLPILEPDLIILSFGTNESFGKLSVSEYIYQLKEFVANVRKLNKNATILVMTPPPSMFRRTRPNQFVTDYSIALMELNTLPVWDLYTRMGGMSGIDRNGGFSEMIARDKVHYTQRGYEIQGNLFASDFIDAYNNYKKQNRN